VAIPLSDLHDGTDFLVQFVQRPTEGVGLHPKYKEHSRSRPLLIHAGIFPPLPQSR
jgi:hypothetical protein